MVEDETPRLTLAIVGRPNVGKSTLFNRLAGRRLALVDDQPGVTRDWRMSQGRLLGEPIQVIDTAGLETQTGDTIEARMRIQTESALRHADAIAFVIDGRAGLTPLDKHFADWLRGINKPVVLVVNKCESNAAQMGLYEAYGLGFGEPIAVSAEHGKGMEDLFQALLPHFHEEPVHEEPEPDLTEEELSEASANEDDDDLLQEEDGPEDRVIQLAIVGRPNVGKSTFVNALLGEERVLTGPEPGVTRDAIAVDWSYQNRRIKLVDTAGLRRKARINERVEKLAVGDTLRTIRMAQCVVLMLDSSAVLDKQDLTIARMVVEEGRALVIAVNKWDAAEDKTEVLQRLKDRLETSLPQIKGVPTVTLSALKGRRLTAVLDAVLETYDIWNKRVSTARLNKWLEGMLAGHPPPLSQGRRIKIRYMTQVKARPPTFALFTSRPEDLPESYLRYLSNGLRDEFGFVGVPLRLYMRKGDNPYA